MLLTVEAPDRQSAKQLVQQLVRSVGGEAVSLASGQEVRIEATHEPKLTLAATLQAVEAWLSDLDVEAATISCDGRTYTVHR